MKNSNESVGNRTFDPPAYNAEPQPTALMHARAGTCNRDKTYNNLALEHLKITYHIEVLRFAWGMTLK